MQSDEVFESEILPERFNLLKKLYISNENDKLGMNRFSIINWLLDQLPHSQNIISPNKSILLWETFSEILEYERCNPGGRILIKNSGISVLVNAVAIYPFECSWAPTILSSIATFLQTPAVNSTLIVDVDRMFFLLISTLKIICKVHKSDGVDANSLLHAQNLSNIILDILENLLLSNEEEKASILKEHLEVLSAFMYIAENNKELEQLSEKLAKRIIAVIFNNKKRHFETLLTPPEVGSKVDPPNTYICEFFSSLQRHLFSEEKVCDNLVPMNAACGILMKKLLTTFLLQNRCNVQPLKVASLLFAVCGLDIPITTSADSCCYSLFKEKSSDIFILGISSLLEGFSAVPLYFTSTSVPPGYLKPAAWLKNVLAALLNIKDCKDKAAWLKCFHSVLLICPQVLKDDIVPLVNAAFLNISVHSTESKKQYCELFDVVLKAHLKLHQVPRFFVKLLLGLTDCIKEDIGGDHLKNGQIFPEVQESIAKCVQELPYGELIEVWKIFIETFSTLENMSKMFLAKKGFTFFVAQLFSNFLLHAQLFQPNIPTNISSQFSGLIHNTSEEVKKISSSLKETDSQFHSSQRSCLLLCYAIKEVKLAYDAYYGNDSDDELNTVMCEDPFDFSQLHDCLGKDCSPILEAFMESDDKISSFLVFQLLLQKIKYYQFKQSLHNEDTNHIQKCVLVILKYVQEGSVAESWDMDLCTLNAKNCGTAYWMSFLKVSPMLLNHLNSKDCYSFCNIAQNIILHDKSPEFGVKSHILASFKNEFYQESKKFQTAFVSAIWKQGNLISSEKRSYEDMEAEHTSFVDIFFLLNMYHSKALKYAQQNPLSSKKLGNLWDEIKKASELLNDILSRETLPKVQLLVSKTTDIIKLFRCLPLEYLLPGNQVKCIIGLSVFLFLVPRSCKSYEIVSVSKEISQLLLSVFESVRSIWLFDFVSSGPYLKYLIKTMEIVISVGGDGNYDWIVQLIEQVVACIVKKIASLESAESFISEIDCENKCSRAVLITLCAMLRKLSRIIPLHSKQEKYKEALVRMASVTVQSLVKQLKNNFKEDMESEDYSYFIKSYMEAIELVCGSPEVEEMSKDCFKIFPKIFEYSLKTVQHSCSEFLSNLCLQFISKASKYSEKLSEFLPTTFVPLSWKILLNHFEEKRKKKLDCFFSHKSSITISIETCDFCVFCSSMSKKASIQEINNSVQQAKCSEDYVILPLKLNEFEEESLRVLSLISSPEILDEVFSNLLKDMSVNHKAVKDVFLIQKTMLLFQCIINANNEKCKLPLLNKHAQELLSELYAIANEACRSVGCQMMVTLPILEFIDFAVNGNWGLPKYMLLQSLHCIAPVSLEVCDNNYEHFVQFFTATLNVVYNLFMRHTSVILDVPALLLVYVKKLLKAIVKAGATDSISKCDQKTILQVQLCAQNMNRLLIDISKKSNTFGKLVPYLVSFYVSTIHNVQLNHDIKQTILLGVYRLLDICSEESIKMQAVNIDSVSREVYENLIKTYKENKQKCVT